MTFEQWLSTLPKHRRDTIEKNDWIGVWLREAWNQAIQNAASIAKNYGDVYNIGMCISDKILGKE